MVAGIDWDRQAIKFGDRWIPISDRFTIMEWTELTDRTGEWIQEGDIVAKFNFDNQLFRSVVVRENGAFGYIGSPFKTFIPFAANIHFDWKDGSSQKIEVIGTIHANPELMREAI